MRALWLSLLLLLPASFAEEVPVVVELFTSEGCNSCPRADQLLRNMASRSPIPGVTIVPLAFHVDYWDSEYWNDPYATEYAGKRQRDYLGELGVNGVYTPQMIVDGRHEFVGSDRKSAMRALMRAAEGPRAELAFEALDERLDLVVHALPEGESGLTLWLAVTEKNLGGHEIEGGENEGRTLRHESVVRHFARLARLGENVELPYRVRVEIPLAESWKRKDLTVVVFAQRDASGPIFGVATREIAGR